MVFGEHVQRAAATTWCCSARSSRRTIDLDAIDGAAGAPEYAPVAQSLREIGIQFGRRSVRDLRRPGGGLEPWLQDAQINRDRNLRLQYLAGLGLNLYQSGPIYAEMLVYRRQPQDLFVGSDALKSAVLAGIEAAGQGQ